ncbi:single-strand selective monofunctional uracil DNA glycosylase-like isoform X3 [Plodia interpunctella]|uniref:single-strand selective monofunctional uracil DNA glycosylase-like isoform X3 n=1 Tax=Plodia interpunctella TaxID=58824 RepID=UPI00236854DC|nr:single-strand selective monofunctional uracil DNA glycosylase-like isoform X3 [Plodia interpunctella]
METAPEVISSFFVSENNVSKAKDIADEFLELLDQLNSSLNQLELPRKVECVYNPTVYARHTFEMYVRKFCNTKKTVMYFGMNPGPWGMSQTGVPFGEISSVKDWLGIEGPVGKPAVEIANRRVLGFACNRTELAQLRPLFDICDPIFCKVLQLYEVKIIIAIGKFCEKRAEKALKTYLPNNSVQILYLPHPSPRVVNNIDWEQKAYEFLQSYNLMQYYSN